MPRNPLKGVERAGRRGLNGLLRILFAGRRGPLPESPRSILVVRTDNRLGNLVLMEPLLRSLGERFPDAALELLLSDVFSDLLVSQGYTVIPVDKKGQIKAPWRFPALVGRLRRRGYEVAIDASHPYSFSLSGAVSAAMAGSPCRIGTPSGRWEGWYTAVPAPPDPDGHESRAIHGLGSVWPGWPGWTPPRLSIEGARPRRAVGIHVGGRPGKAYPEERLAEIVRGISAFCPVELYWGGEGEQRRAAAVSSGSASVMPVTDVTGFMRNVAGLSVFVSPDTGPMHVASALGVPTVGLFRTDNAGRFAPLSPGSVVLRDPDGAAPGLVVDAVRAVFG
jgi:ADP-heptose:LPS heptosyltransferase